MNKRNDYQNIERMTVLVPDADDWLTLRVLRCLGQESIFKNHILSKKKMPLSRFSRHCTSFHLNNSRNDDEWIEEINKLIAKFQINIILPVTVQGVELISKNRNKISKSALIPPLAEPEKIALTNDKLEFHKFLIEEGLPSLPTINAGISGENIQKTNLDSIEFPALLKPASESGGFGIVKVEDVNELERAWQDTRISKNHNYILQSYIPADHYGLSIYSREGDIIAYTLYHSLLHSNPYRIGILMEFENDDRIINLGKQLISKLKWSGVANIDFLVDKRDKSVKILEFNPRFWQSLLGSANAGVNFPVLYCLDAAGVKLSFRQHQSRYVSPMMYIKTFLKHLKGKRTNIKIRWRDSGFKFTYSDPVPEIVDILNRTGKRLKQWII